MDVYLAFTLFSFIILLYWIISELFTILFRFTGLPAERARFQVTSLLTGCGFTTRESEMILSSRQRRRMARITMLFGYVFNITIVSAFINVFLSLKLAQVRHYLGSFLIPLAPIAVIVTFMRVPAIRAWGNRQLERVANRFVLRDPGNYVMILDAIGSDTIALVTLKTVPDELRGVPLSQTGLRAEKNLLVMLLERDGRKAVPAGADTVFQDGDHLTVFGSYPVICQVFQAKERFAES